MMEKEELLSIAIVSLILAFAFSIAGSFGGFVYVFASVLVIVCANTLAKKISSFYLDSEIEVKVWEIQRYGFKPQKHLERPFPAGLFLPVIVAVVSLGYLKWMASLVFDVKAKAYRAAKRFGIYSFSEMTEYHLALIAASGVMANIALSVLGYLTGFDNFARLSIYYAFFSIIPLSDLDGNKIFFGSVILWSALAAVCLLGLGYVFLVV
jgi:hypothetical protein